MSWRRLRSTVPLLLVWSLATPIDDAAATVDHKEIFGWAEKVLIGESQVALTAKLDTGADTSSVHTAKIRRFRSDTGQVWVEFRVSESGGDRTIRFRKRLVRYAYIKEHEGPSQKRPVVNMEICLGTHRTVVEVSLVDRGSFDFPVLLGRNALTGRVVVDPELDFTAPPSCPAVERP